MSGWWGNDPATRFRMAETFEPAAGADGWRISTPPILSLAPIRASLAIFEEVGIEALRAKSVRLTGYLEGLLDALVSDAEILNPMGNGPRARFIAFRHADAQAWKKTLLDANVVTDVRDDVLRAGIGLYHDDADVDAFCEAAKRLL